MQVLYEYKKEIIIVMKKTLIIGASNNPERYAYKAAERLLSYGHEIELLGLRNDEIFGKVIDTERKQYTGVDTVTLYVGPQRQPDYYDYVLSLKPRRVIFNPGTENNEFETLLRQNGIEAEEACTLVLLGTGQF
ncbi:MAG: CoA-binding protein [Bacteroidetes bacterium]|jgi:predicted CoA-binding protein|nr:CoA-binding protein [Bacteroidota bacterium]